MQTLEDERYLEEKSERENQGILFQGHFQNWLAWIYADFI
jgi:hypothetical protein